MIADLNAIYLQNLMYVGLISVALRVMKMQSI